MPARVACCCAQTTRLAAYRAAGVDDLVPAYAAAAAELAHRERTLAELSADLAALRAPAAPSSAAGLLYY